MTIIKSGSIRISALFLGLAFCFAAPKGAVAEETYVPGELLVKFRTTSNAKIDAAIKTIGGRVQEKLSRIKVSRITLPEGMTVEKGAEALKKLGLVKYAEPNYIHYPFWEPSDPKFDEQWGLKKIDAPGGWSMETGSNKSVIAIVDTGVDMDHPDLKNKLVSGYDFYEDDNWPDDTESHGTHCAGIAAASTNNNKGVAGVCPNCAVMPVRVFGGSGGSSSTVAKGVIWAVDHGADVISLSLGSPYPSSTLMDAINYASNKGAIIIAAAGNNNTSAETYPANFDRCLAVGSTDSNDTRSSFSNYGSWVDVAAPGSQIVSTVPGGGYGYKSGTSMATPYVAGLAGLLFSCGGANAYRVREAIEKSGHHVGSWNAYGRVNVKKALQHMGCGGNGGGGNNNSGDNNSGGNNNSGSGGSSSGNYKVTGPSSYHVTWGATVSAPGNSLVHSDNSRLVLKGKGKGVSNILDFYVASKGQSTAGAKKLFVKLEANFSKPGELTAYFYNWNTEGWDWIEKQYLDYNDKTVYFTRYDPAPYISGSGEVRVKFYRKEKRWTAFEFRGDLIKFVVETQ